jgi:oligopeptide transport system substrate-binding protein
MTKWLKGKEIDFDRNPTYYGKAPAVAHVVAYIEPSAEKARRLFYDDRLDVLLDVTAADLVDFSPASGRQLKQFDYIAAVFLTFNTTNPPFVSSDLRRAVAQAFDRSGLQAALKGGQVPADSLIPRGIAGYEKAALQFSPDQARQSLQAAGFKSPSTVPPLSLLAIQNLHTALAEYIKETLRRTLDVNVAINYEAPAEYVKSRKAGHYHMMIWQWGADYPDASSFMELFLSENPVNTTGWKNVQYDRLVTSAGGSLKVLDRLKAYSEAQRLLLQQDAVVVPLYYPKITALLAPTVRELDINALNYLFFKRIVMK